VCYSRLVTYPSSPHDHGAIYGHGDVTEPP
jgi:hypothetical protein